ncbi:MAG: SOS response-associated peptidase [Bacteroidetes bacterium]|nr:SOS response-associated peptidase [Bacteroidota bacterium]
MCYSNSTTSTNIDLAGKYKKKIPSNQADVIHYYASGFTRPLWPVINQSEEIQFMKWGLVPNWYRGELSEIASKTVNCRIETAHSKSSFKHLINSKRCVVPSSGFFEWQHLGKEKIPYFIYSPETKILSIAGLWESNIDAQTGQFQNTFTLFTIEANDFMAEIHNAKKRMPLFLNSESAIEEWLSCESEITSFSMPAKETILSAHSVDKTILLSSNSNLPEVNLPFENRSDQLSLF